MYFKKVQSNIKGMGEHELDPCVVVVGKSGQGKSAIVDSYKLVLDGEAKTPGLGKKLGYLNSTLPEDEELIKVVGILDDDSVVDVAPNGTALAYRWSNDAKLKIVGHDYAGAVEDLLLGQASRLAKRIIEASGLTIAWHRIVGAVPTELAGKLLDAFHAAGVKVETDAQGVPIGSQTFLASQVGQVAEHVKSQIRSVKKGLKEHKQSSSAPVEALTAEEEQEIFQLREVQQQLAHLPTTPEHAQETLQQVYVQLAESQKALEGLASYAQADIDQVDDNIVLFAVLRDTLTQTLQLAQSQPAVCPACGASVDVQGLQARIEMIERSRAESEAWVMQARQVASQRSMLEVQISQLEHRRNQLTEVITQGTVSEGFDATRLAELEQRRTGHERMQKALDAMPKLERKHEDLEVLKKALQGQLDQAVVDAVSTIERRVNTFLPKRYRAKIAQDGQNIAMSANSTAGPFHDYRALSKAQRVLLGVALAAATIPEDAPPVRALVIDEVPMDTATAKTLMKAVAANVAKGGGFSQAIISLVSLTGQTPDGWRKISVDPAKRTGKRTEEKEKTDE